jgi:co-chaperonin GroES (HSP10)
LGVQTLLILQHDEVVIVEPNNTKQLGEVDNVDVNEGLGIITKQFKAIVLRVQGRNYVMVAQIIEL